MRRDLELVQWLLLSSEKMKSWKSLKEIMGYAKV
jgi:hypothetical protein